MVTTVKGIQATVRAESVRIILGDFGHFCDQLKAVIVGGESPCVLKMPSRVLKPLLVIV